MFQRHQTYMQSIYLLYTNAFCIQKYNIYFIIQLIIYINITNKYNSAHKQDVMRMYLYRNKKMHFF